MGRGDIKSKKGKISNGSYGVRRKRKQAKKYVAGGEVKAKPAATLFPDEEVKKAAKPARPAGGKAAPKKAAAKAEGEEAPKKKAAPKKKKTEE